MVTVIDMMGRMVLKNNPIRPKEIIDPQEWQGRGAKRTVADVTKQIARLRDDERAVLLMHDTKVETRFALPQILDRFAEMGLEVKTVSEVLEG